MLRADSLNLSVALQPQLVRPRLHGLYAKIDMLFERHAQFRRAFHDILPVYAARERLVLHLLLHRRSVHFEYAAARLDIGNRGDESGQLVARIQHLFERRYPRYAAVIGMRKDGAPDLL